MIPSRYQPQHGPLRQPPGRLFVALRVTMLLTPFLILACGSPEVGRPPGDPGADVKNWGRPVELHAGAEPYHDTPCVTDKVECQGPLPVFGPTPPPD
jgi:hypothetical protein